MAARTAYLGPAGSWTHQACLDLYGADGLVPLSREALFAAYADGKVERACVPVATSVVGLTPYMEDVLALPRVVVVAEYPKMLGYSLLARPGTRREDIKEVHATEGAFLLRFFGLMEMDESEWQAIFRDIRAVLVDAP
ncbi:prephenate dehydratase domain-containing protein [Bordetella pertussis]|uniref:prephenate dehydratase domain-containing protein n=1 Tax=Bordetella pertussis TaxID=520 RepID=UPI00366BF9E1